MSIHAVMLASLVAAADAAISAPASGAPGNGVSMVRHLYALEATPTHVRGLFAADLAEAYEKDIGVAGEVGAIDFDWRYGAQDFRITHFRIGLAPLPAAEGGGPVFTSPALAVSFKNFGRAHMVIYRFCRTPAREWRIYDVESQDPPDPWSLRKLLKLGPASTARC